MTMLKEERTQREEAEAKLATLTSPTTTTQTRPPKVAAPDKFHGERGAKAETFLRQVAIYINLNVASFPTEASQILFAASHLSGTAGVWAALHIDEAMGQGKRKYTEFSADFAAMYFDSEKKSKAEQALRALKQTGSVADYTHVFIQHATAAGWETPTLISQCRQGLKKDIRTMLVACMTAFESVGDVAALALQLDTEMTLANTAQTPTATASRTDPDAMDISAMRTRLSDSDKARMMREGLCFRCGTQGHIARECPAKKDNGRGTARIAAIEGQIRKLAEGMAALKGGGAASTEKKGRAESSKNGGAQE
jgi:hypothetical protein